MENDYAEQRHRLLANVEQGALQLRTVFPALSRSSYVGGEGPDTQPIAFVVGEAPGAEEDMRRRPFIGPAGLALRQLMRLGGLEPTECWITNALKFRTPGNRQPMSSEIRAFRPLLIGEWRAVGKPNLIVTVGVTAYEAVTGRRQRFTTTAGKPVRLTTGATVYPMVHPAVGLRGDDRAKERLESDWEKFGEWYAESLD